MESLACGTPCVAFNIGGMPDMIKHKVNGYLSIPFDTNDLANGIKWVLNNNIDNSLSINARNTACKNYNVDNISQKYIDLYRDVLA
jgi:glycosyltransferase involved in cell wall biosynthesis